MDNRTRRTILRKTNTSSIQTVNDQVANLASFTGLNDSANYTTVDQNSFSEANNVYVDADNELTTRPPVKFGKLFEGMPSGDIEAVYTSNGTVFYLMDHVLYFRWGGVLYNIGELYEETTDDDGNTVLNYYTQFKITWINDMFVIFERYVDESGEKHTSLFGLQFKDGEWVRYEYMQLLYISKRDYLSKEDLESPNLFIDGAYIDYIFDGISENEAANSRALNGQEVEITVRDKTFNIIWDVQYSNVLIADVCDTLINISFDSYEQSSDGYVILLYNKNDKERKAWLSVNGGYGWIDITLGGGTLKTDADFTLCLSEDGAAIFMFLHEKLETKEAELDPHYGTTLNGLEDSLGLPRCMDSTAYTCTSTLYVGTISSDAAQVSWTHQTITLLDNDTPFTSKHITDITSDDVSSINGFTDDKRFSVDCLFEIGTNKDRKKIFSTMETFLAMTLDLDSRYVKMHAPDYMHCAILIPVKGNHWGTCDVNSTAGYTIEGSTVTEFTFCDTYFEYYDLTLATTGTTDEDTENILYPSTTLLHGPLFLNSTTIRISENNPNIFIDTGIDVAGAPQERHYTDLIVYANGTTTHSIGLSDEDADDATNHKNGKVRYIATNTSYDMILSFNGDNGGSYTMVPTSSLTFSDVTFKSKMLYGSGGWEDDTAKTKSIDMSFDPDCYVPAYTALGHRTAFGKNARSRISSDYFFSVVCMEVYTTDYRIFKNIANQPSDEEPALEQEEINKMFSSNTDETAAETQSDNFAVLQSLVDTQDDETIDGLACEIFNVYANSSGISANVGVLKDLGLIDYFDDIDCMAAQSVRIPFLLNDGDTIVGVADSVSIPYMKRNDNGGVSTGSYMLTGNVCYNKNSYLPLHVFGNLEKTLYDSIPNVIENEFEERIAFAHMYYEFQTITKDIDAVQGFELDDYTDVEHVIIDKNITALMFITEDFLYYNQYAIPFFWAGDDFTFVPLSIMTGTKYFVGIDMETTRIWSSDYSYNGTTFEVEGIEINSIDIKFPDFDSFLYSSTSLIFGNEIYQTQISSEDNYDETGYKKLYIPKNTLVTLPDPVTNVTNFSQTVTGIFTEHTAFEYTFDEDYGAYRLFPTKLTIGSREGYDVVPALSADSIFISTVFGFRQLGYESFVQSTEQQLSIADDAINGIFKDFDTSPIKAQVFSYWILLYKTDDTTVLVLDARTGAWWKWTLPFAPELMYMIDDELYLYKDKSIYTLDFNADTCYDMNGEPIDWYFVSQKLHFSAPTYYKHINQLSIISTPKTDTMRYALELYSYHNGYSEKEDTVVKYDVDTVANCIERFNFMKSNAFQFKISSDDSDKYPTKFRTSCISIKYRVTEKVR